MSFLNIFTCNEIPSQRESALNNPLVVAIGTFFIITISVSWINPILALVLGFSFFIAIIIASIYDCKKKKLSNTKNIHNLSEQNKKKIPIEDKGRILDIITSIHALNNSNNQKIKEINFQFNNFKNIQETVLYNSHLESTKSKLIYLFYMTGAINKLGATLNDKETAEKWLYFKSLELGDKLFTIKIAESYLINSNNQKYEYYSVLVKGHQGMEKYLKSISENVSSKVFMESCLELRKLLKEIQ